MMNLQPYYLLCCVGKEAGELWPVDAKDSFSYQRCQVLKDKGGEEREGRKAGERERERERRRRGRKEELKRS